MARLGRSFPGFSNTHTINASIGAAIILAFPPEADGTGAGVAAVPTIGAVPTDNGTNAGVGVNPTVQLVAGTNVIPSAALGSGVGVTPTAAFVINVGPVEADGLGVGIGAAAGGLIFALPVEADGIGAGWLPLVAVPPVPLNGLAIFMTPQVRDRPPYLPNSTGQQYRLMRHFENRLRGVLVWERNDGTYVVDTPCNYEAAMTQPAAYFSDDSIGPDLTADFQGLTDSNVNYPWNPKPGSTNSTIPGSYAYNVNWDQTTQDFILNPYLIQWWEGGAYNVITQDQALALTVAGFGDCISSDAYIQPVVVTG